MIYIMEVLTQNVTYPKVCVKQ